MNTVQEDDHVSDKQEEPEDLLPVAFHQDDQNDDNYLDARDDCSIVSGLPKHAASCKMRTLGCDLFENMKAEQAAIRKMTT
jgi:hypothetical protein